MNEMDGERKTETLLVHFNFGLPVLVCASLRHTKNISPVE